MIFTKWYKMYLMFLLYNSGCISWHFCSFFFSLQGYVCCAQQEVLWSSDALSLWKAESANGPGSLPVSSLNNFVHMTNPTANSSCFNTEMSKHFSFVITRYKTRHWEYGNANPVYLLKLNMQVLFSLEYEMCYSHVQVIVLCFFLCFISHSIIL